MDKIGAATENVIQRISQSTPTNLPKRLPATGPAGADRLCDIALPRLVCWRPDKGPLEIVRALDAEERSRLAALEVELEYCLMPYDGEMEGKEVRFAITILFSGFRSLLRQEGISVEILVDTLMVHLGDMPAWAIKQGCKLIGQQDRPFAPNDGQIITAIRDVARVHQDRLRNVRALLAAEVADRTPLVQTPRKTVDRFGDGKHAQRIAADLAARAKAKEEATDAARIEPAQEGDA